MDLTMLYVHGEQIGYARAGNFVAEELMRRGYTLYDDDGYEGGGTSHQKLREGHHSIAPSPTNLICLVSVPTHLKGWFNKQHVAILTMWEAQTMPESFRDTFHHYDTILVPSQQNLELFSKYHDNVQYIPLGVETSRWHYKPAPPVLGEFRYMIGGRGERKGTDLAYLAFRKVFPRAKPIKGGPVPKLIMKSSRGLGDYYAPGITHVTGKLDADTESDLYESIHCYLQPSRGEGWGLQPLQAIAMGRPTILTDAHGHKAFSHLGIPISATTSKAAYFIYGDAGLWWEPDLEELCEAMYDVYINYDKHVEQAKVNSIIATDTFTWQKTTDRFVEILGDQMDKPYVGDGNWETPEPNLFKIITNKDWYGEIGGRSLQFTKGKEYWDTSDVKRIFFDANVLDAACIDDNDVGLAPIQIQQIDEYKAYDEICSHCGQVLNSGIKGSDREYAKIKAAYDAP
jgi:glycosyltransferase involved in cell wall biosynthesis